MAKQPSSKSGTSRIRFIMLDAELPEGDLSQITLAIQNALRPTTTIVQQRLPVQEPTALPGRLEETSSGADDVLSDSEEHSLDQAEMPRKLRVPRPRKHTSPKVLNLDLSSDMALDAFVDKHLPKNDIERNLVVLAWFKEHRSEPAITANHIYTCYRALKWPSAIEDFSWPLRSLKKEQLVTSPTRGHFTINHLGIARVEKMGPAP